MVGILGANSVSGGGYEIDNSLRFNDNDSPRLEFTPASAGDRKTYTLSVWFKLTVFTTAHEKVIFGADDGTGGNNNFDYFSVGSNFTIKMYGYTGSENQSITSTQFLRDPSAWYHFVAAVDTTQGTASNRVKFYLNGSQITDFSTANYPSLNYQGKINNNNVHKISSYPDRTDKNFDGYMAETHFIDGQALTPSDFGEFNDNGVWIPKAYTGSYGTNGFYLEFKETGTGTDASGMGADTSGNDNHWAVTNLAATDVTTDTPTNNFATLNPLQITNSDITLSEGNLKHTIVNNWKYTPANMAATNGKWYAEVKAEDASNFLVGFMALGGDSDKTSVMNTNNTTLGNAADGWSMLSPSYSDTAYKNNNTGSVAISGTHIANNDIVILAMDLDNQKIYFGRNGTWNNSGNPATETNPAFTNLTAGIFYTFASSGENSTNNWNFGNPLYTISSGNADANGYGNFEYAVPSGYYSLCTKNLAEFG